MDVVEEPVATRLPGTRHDRVAGRWAAWMVAVLSVVYAVVVGVGFGDLGNLVDPLPDPYLAVAEVLILLMAPAMVVLMAAVHACAPVHLRLYSLLAFGWMLVAACLTMTVHVVELVVARRIEPAAVPGYDRLFDFAWPSMLYAVDVVAWDLLLGLSLACAALVFPGQRHRAVRRVLLLSAALCLVGLVGPAIDVMAWRGLGILGYVVVFPVACVLLTRVFFAADPDSAVPRVAEPARLGADR